MSRSIMKIAAVTGIASMAAAPALAQNSMSQYTAASVAAYEQCKTKDTEGQVLGAIVGGVLGGVLGNEVEKGEGTVIGGAAGAYAGTQVANKDCESRLVPLTTATYDSRFTRYDARTGEYYDTRTGAAVTATPRDSEVAGAFTTSPDGLVRVTDDNGRTFYVSQSDYERYYKN